ncbi:hypothetical protein LINPERHAP2_LOCUS15548, partial [Linum perenne]
EQVANIEHGQTVEDVAGIHGGDKEARPQPVAPSADLGEAIMSLRHTMVEHRQLMEASMAGNARQDAIEKGRIKFPEPRKDAMFVDTDPFPATVGVNMVNPDFSKIELPRFKLVLDTTPPQEGSSSSNVQSTPASLSRQDEEKLCVQCKRSLNFDEVKPSKPVYQMLGPPPNRPRYPPYQRMVEGVRQPFGWQPRQWLAPGHPMKRTFRILDVPHGGWHTYDIRS